MTYSNGLSIDGIHYNVPVVELVRAAEFLDKYAERTGDGILHRELIGVYYNFRMTIGFDGDYNTYNSLWNKLTEPVEYHQIVLPYDVGNYAFQAYVAGVTDSAEEIVRGRTYYDNLACEFIARSPARR